MDYPKKTLTRDGAALLANDDADGYNTVIDYVITSDELPDSSEELDDIEVGDFHNPKKIKIDSYQHQGSTFQPEATWNNSTQPIKSEYPIQMFGLLAHGAKANNQDETLLAVAVSDGSPFIMPATTKVPFTFTMALTLTYSNASNVTADVDDVNAVTNEQLINTLKNKDAENNKTYETVINANSAISSLTKTDSSLKADITNLSTSANATFETSANANSAHNSLVNSANSAHSSLKANIDNLNNNLGSDTVHELSGLANNASSFTSTDSSLSASINTLSNSDNNAHDSILAKAAALHSSLQANIDDVNKTTHRELGGFETMPAANQAHHSLEAELQSLNNNVGNGVSASASSLSTQANNLQNQINNRPSWNITNGLQNQINQKPNWADENWTRNQVAPSLANSAATNAMNQAEQYTNNKISNSILFNYNPTGFQSLNLNNDTSPGIYTPVNQTFHYWNEPQPTDPNYTQAHFNMLMVLPLGSTNYIQIAYMSYTFVNTNTSYICRYKRFISSGNPSLNTSWMLTATQQWF